MVVILKMINGSASQNFLVNITDSYRNFQKNIRGMNEGPTEPTVYIRNDHFFHAGQILLIHLIISKKNAPNITLI